MEPIPTPPLRAAKHRAAQLLFEAVSQQNGPDPQKLEIAERLMRAVELLEKSRASVARRVLVYAGAVTAAILLLLASIPIRKLEVRGSIRSQSLGLRSQRAVYPIEQQVVSFSAAGFQVDSATAAEFGADSVAALGFVMNATMSRSVTLNQITVPPGTYLELSVPSPGIVGIRVQCETACAAGRVHLTRLDSLTAGSPLAAAAELRFGHGDNYIELQVRDTTFDFAVGAPLESDTLAYESIRTDTEGNTETRVAISSIVGGELYDLTMENDKEMLGRGDRVQFGLGSYRIDSIRLERGSIATEFRGESGSVLRAGEDLRPSILEWLWARALLKVLWSAFVATVAVIIAVFRWSNPHV